MFSKALCTVGSASRAETKNSHTSVTTGKLSHNVFEGVMTEELLSDRHHKMLKKFKFSLPKRGLPHMAIENSIKMSD